MVVTLPSSDMAPGTFTVSLPDAAVTDPNEAVCSLFSSCFATRDCWPSQMTIPVSRLDLKIQPSYKTIHESVVQKALDPKRNHESLAVFSFQQLEITAAPYKLKTRFIDLAEVRVQWMPNEALGAIAYAVTMMEVEAQGEIFTEQTVPAIGEDGFMATTLTLPEATGKAACELISIRVAAKRAGFVNRISEYTIKVAIPRVLKIELSSNLHVDSGVLTLVVSSNTPFTLETTFKVLRTTLAAANGQEQEIVSTCFHDRHAVLRLQPSPPIMLLLTKLILSV